MIAITRRILGVDYGETRTGLAVSDEMQFLASGIGYIKCSGIKNIADEVAKKATELDVCEIVVGMPVNMNGTLGEKSERIKEFIHLLSDKVAVPINTLDERVTTMAAHQILNFTNIKSSKRKGVIDTLSAQIILQNYLDRRKNSNMQNNS